MRTIVLLALVLSFGCTQKQSEDSIRLIPEGYTGPVLVIFNQEDGEPEEYEGDKRVYRIPNNGVLHTQFAPNYGIQNHFYYHVGGNGDRRQIPFFNVYNKDTLKLMENKLEIYAFWEKALGEGRKFDPETKKLISKKEPAKTFYIGNLSDIEKSAREQMNFVFDHNNQP